MGEAESGQTSGLRAGMLFAEQQKLALHAEMTRQSIHKITTGASRPDINIALRIAGAVGVSVEASPGARTVLQLPPAHLDDNPINDL